jgi:hypothetical protein
MDDKDAPPRGTLGTVLLDSQDVGDGRSQTFIEWDGGILLGVVQPADQVVVITEKVNTGG